jgi:hypothetical protein
VTLEDSLGDILRKARTSTHTEPAAAAQAAGVSVSDYERMEESGKPAAGCRFNELGAKLSLDGAKLKRIAEGWLPKPVATSGWCELRVITTEGEGMAVHAYLVWDEVTREAAVFDTGFDAAPILALIDEHGLQLKHIFIKIGRAHV